MIKFTRRFWLASALGHLAFWLPGCGKPAAGPGQGTDADRRSGNDGGASAEPVRKYVLVISPERTTLASAIGARGNIAGQFNTSAHLCHACLWGPDGSIPQDLDSPAGVWSGAWALNKRGHVVGELRSDHTGNIQAFLWTGGSMQHLKTLGGGESRAFAINDDGLIAGSATGKEERSHAVLWDREETTPLEPLGPVYADAQALALNQRGDVVGSCYNDRIGRAVVWKACGKPQELPVPSQERARETPSIATAINNESHIVGCYGDGAFVPRHACRWIGGEFADLHVAELGGSSVASSVNNAGHVVGFYTSHRGDDRAFLYAHGKMHDLNELLIGAGGLVLRYAKMIDDRGWIVGAGSMGKNGDPRAFVLRPV
jgi:probable HAF family extracellular repeat protein